MRGQSTTWVVEPTGRPPTTIDYASIVHPSVIDKSSSIDNLLTSEDNRGRGRVGRFWQQARTYRIGGLVQKLKYSYRVNL